MKWPAGEDHEYASVVGHRLRGWGVLRRLTQQQIAHLVGVDRALSIAAERRSVTLDPTRIRRLAPAVGAPLPDLIDEDRRRGTDSYFRPAPRRR